MATMKLKKRGFNLIEIILVVTLMAILLAISMRSGPGKTRANSRLVAHLVASELNFARTKAQKTGDRVAVSFPSDSGQRSFSDGLYQVSGALNPRLEHVRTWRNEQQGTFLFAGAVGSSATSPTTALDTASWGHPHPMDPSICFLPNGTIESNIPYTSDGYILVALEGGTAAAGSLRSSYDPYTIKISDKGTVEVEKGLPAGHGTTADNQPSNPAVGTLPSPLGGPNRDPHTLVVDHSPRTQLANMPPGIDATITPDGYLTLKMSCEDDEGDRLSCIWTCDNGVLSADYEVEMTWSEANQHWEGVWVWYPPDNAAPGDIYRLSCEVRDQRGGVIQGQLGVQGQALVIPQDRVLFSSNEDGDKEIFVVNADGSGLTQLTHNDYGDTQPHWFPDGRQFIFTSRTPGVGASAGVYVANSDGSGKRPVFYQATYGLDRVHAPKVSPDGTQIAFVGFLDPSNEADIYVVNVDGTDPDNPGTPGIKRLTNQNWLTASGLTWSNDGRYLVMGGDELWEYDTQVSSLRQLTSNAGMSTVKPQLSPAGTELYFFQWGSSVPSQGCMATYNPGGTLGAIAPASGNGRVNELCWSPDATRIASLDGDRTELVVSDPNGGNPIGIHSVPAGSGFYMASPCWTRN